VIRQLGAMVVEVDGIHRLQRFADSPVQHSAAFVQHRVVGYVMGQRMLECVLDVADGRAVRR
jgi:hypothetical protein